MHVVAVFEKLFSAMKPPVLAAAHYARYRRHWHWHVLEFSQSIICTSSAQGIPVLEQTHCRISFLQWFGNFFVNILSSEEMYMKCRRAIPFFASS